jgi:dienelactone hydrolase
MNKLFYSTIILSTLLFSCTSNTDKGEMKEVSNSIANGQAGSITITAKDGLEMTADYYPNSEATTLIILCHQAGYSRGEYSKIAPRLVDSGFACLAIDQRSGKLVNEVFNETAKRAEAQGLSTNYIDAKADLLASVDYVKANTDKKIILWGSSYSASLALMVGAENVNVEKIVAFSPGEYLDNQDRVGSSITNLDKPVFMTGGSEEYDMIVKPLEMALPKGNVTAIKQGISSDHGSKTLWNESKNAQNVWAEVVSFLRS